LEVEEEVFRVGMKRTHEDYFNKKNHMIFLLFFGT